LERLERIIFQDAGGRAARIRVASTLVGTMDQASNDLATLLVDEFDAWFRSLGAGGFIPRAFTGVTKGGKQCVVTLTGLPFDHVQRRDFLVWLCRAEQFEVYAYGTHVGIIDDASFTASEGIKIYASSECYDVEKTLGIDRTIDGKYVFFDQHYVVLPARSENGIFLGLQRSTQDIPSDSQELFRELWRDMKSRVLWLQR
jgi:hypothetical protein